MVLNAYVVRVRTLLKQLSLRTQLLFVGVLLNGIPNVIFPPYLSFPYLATFHPFLMPHWKVNQTV